MASFFAGTGTSPAAKPGLVHISAEVAEKMRSRLPAQTSVAITGVFGISQNTWVKIRDGHPIRRLVGERLLKRLASQER